MKYFKLNILAILSLVTGLCACTVDEPQLNESERSISATIMDHGTQTRAIVLDNPGTRLDIYWHQNDHIGLFGTGGSNVDYALSDYSLSANSKTARFVTTEEKIPTGEILAYTPYQAGTTSSDGKIYVDVPSEQTFTWAKGVAQPDPSANLMLARGTRGGGLSFYPVMAVLKIGKQFDKDVSLKSVEFSDLDKQPVCGSAALSWKDGVPTCEMVGSGDVITLSGPQPLSISENEVRVFYLTIPARHYSKGFQITFVTTDGERISQTVGATHGKDMQAGVLYPVGDLAPDVVDVDGKCELKPNTIMMTPENLDKITIKDKRYQRLTNVDGGELLDAHGRPIGGYKMELEVSKDLHPAEGGWMIFNQPSDDLPNGGVFKIESVTKATDDTYRVTIVTDPNPFAPFKLLELGQPMYDENGVFHEEAGVPLNFNGKLREIVDENGESIDFSLTPNGEIVFTEEAVAQMLGVDKRAVSRAHNMTVSTPNFSICASGDNAEANFSPKFETSVTTAVGVFDGELQYICAKLDPVFKLESSFTLKAGFSVSKSVHLVTLVFSPVFVYGVYVNLEIEVSLTAAVGGEITFQTTLSCTQDLGSYTIAYNKGDGFALRKNREPSLAGYNLQEPTLSAGGSLYAQAGVTVVPSLHFYAMANIGLSCDMNIKAAYTRTGGETVDTYGGAKFTIGPEMQIMPCVALGGLLPVKWTHNFKELTLKFTPDPWYEQYYLPECKPGKMRELFIRYKTTPGLYDIIPSSPGKPGFASWLNIGLESLDYSVALSKKCATDIDVCMAYYELTNYDVIFSTLATDRDREIYARGHVFGTYSSIHPKMNPDGTSPFKLVALQHLGTYPALTENQDFSGTIAPPSDLAFKTHTYYKAVPVIARDNKIEVMLGNLMTWDDWPESYIYIQGYSDPSGVPYERSN